MEEHTDPVRMQRELWRDLLREATQRLASAGGSGAEADLAAFNFVLAAGKCDRWGAEYPSGGPRVPEPIVAQRAIERLKTMIGEVMDAARSLPEQLEQADDFEAMRQTVDVLESREAIEACLAAIFEAYMSGNPSDPEISRLGASLRSVYPLIWSVDDALQAHAELLCLATATHALDNWRALLADKHKDVLPWWLDGSLEQVYQLIRQPGIEAEDLALLRSGQERGGGVRVIPGRWRYRYTEAERRDMALAAATGEISHADQWQFSRWCQCVLPNGAKLSVSIQVTSQGGVELRLGGDENVIQKVSGIRIGSRAAALSDPSLLFHWVLIMECPADRQILATLKQEPLSIELHDGTRILIQGEE